MSDQPFADQLATQWAAMDPAARPPCVKCREQFPIIGPGGAPSVVCPHCGFCPSEECCKYAIKQLQLNAARVAAERQTAEPAPAPVAGPGLGDVIGNAAAVLQIRTALDAHRARIKNGEEAAFPHTIFSASGGTGKSMMARIIAREVGRPLRVGTGQSLQNPTRVADMLLSLKSGDVLFIDEIQGLRPQCQDMLLLAMEDRIIVPIERGKSSNPVRLPPFTLIGSTTDEYKLSNPLLQRFKYIIHLQRMTVKDLANAVSDRARRKSWNVTIEAAEMIAARAHGTPRLALRLLDNCMDAALAGDDSLIDAIVVKATCEIGQIDDMGLDAAERKYLELLESAGGGPVRVNVIAAQMDNQTRRNLELKVEPELIYLGLIAKQPNGRVLTKSGRQHLCGYCQK